MEAYTRYVKSLMKFLVDFFLQTEIEKELLNEGGGIQPTDS
jgi:hypothetical protein